MSPNDPSWQQTVITITPAILAFLTAALAAVLTYMTHRGVATVAQKVEDVHLVVNSRLDALVEATRRAAHAEGIQSERDRQALLVPDTTPDRQAGGQP